MEKVSIADLLDQIEKAGTEQEKKVLRDKLSEMLDSPPGSSSMPRTSSVRQEEIEALLPAEERRRLAPGLSRLVSPDVRAVPPEDLSLSIPEATRQKMVADYTPPLMKSSVPSISEPSEQSKKESEDPGASVTRLAMAVPRPSTSVSSDVLSPATSAVTAVPDYEKQLVDNLDKLEKLAPPVSSTLGADAITKYNKIVEDLRQDYKEAKQRAAWGEFAGHLSKAIGLLGFGLSQRGRGPDGLREVPAIETPQWEGVYQRLRDDYRTDLGLAEKGLETDLRQADLSNKEALDQYRDKRGQLSEKGRQLLDLLREKRAEREQSRRESLDRQRLELDKKRLALSEEKASKATPYQLPRVDESAIDQAEKQGGMAPVINKELDSLAEGWFSSSPNKKKKETIAALYTKYPRYKAILSRYLEAPDGSGLRLLSKEDLESAKKEVQALSTGLANIRPHLTRTLEFIAQNPESPESLKAIKVLQEQGLLRQSTR